MPDDGHRYELIDGVLVVSPAPRPTGLLGPPLPAVEVLSPGNRGVDLVSERARHESAGCPSYWIIDPDPPSLLPLELGPDGYRDTAPVTGGEAFAATAPFAVTVRPAELVAG